jgi:hypothetical protein
MLAHVCPGRWKRNPAESRSRAGGHAGRPRRLAVRTERVRRRCGPTDLLSEAPGELAAAVWFLPATATSSHTAVTVTGLEEAAVLVALGWYLVGTLARATKLYLGGYNINLAYRK